MHLKSHLSAPCCHDSVQDFGWSRRGSFGSSLPRGGVQWGMAVGSKPGRVTAVCLAAPSSGTGLPLVSSVTSSGLLAPGVFISSRAKSFQGLEAGPFPAHTPGGCLAGRHTGPVPGRTPTPHCQALKRIDVLLLRASGRAMAPTVVSGLSWGLEAVVRGTGLRSYWGLSHSRALPVFGCRYLWSDRRMS